VIRRLFSRLSRRPRPAIAGTVDRAAIERLTGLVVRDLSLYERALTHRSLLRSEQSPHLRSNERLEYLGDAVLGMVVAEHVFKRFPDKDEGYLTRLRAKLVNRHALAQSATELNLGEVILMSKAISDTTGRTSESILADAFEAVIGAIYLDLGIEATRTFIRKTVLHQVDLAELARQRVNFKSHLLEFAQAKKWPQPDYRVVEESGPSHDKTFRVEVLLSGKSMGEGTAKSKKEAEQIAARRALGRLNEGDPN
jgi:ribonuclease-3